MPTLKRLTTKAGVDGGCKSIFFAGNGSFAYVLTGSSLVTIGLDGVVLTQQKLQGYVHCSAFAPACSLLAVEDCIGSNAKQRSRVVIFNADTGERVSELKNPGKSTTGFLRVLGLDFCPDGKSLVLVFRRQVELWDVGTGKRRRLLSGPGGGEVVSTAVSPDGSRAAIAVAGQGVRIHAISSGEILEFRDDLGIDIGDLVCWTPDSKGVLCACGGKLSLWNQGAGKIRDLGKLVAPSTLAVAPDGKFAVAGTYGGDLLMFSLEASAGKPGQRKAHSGRVYGIGVSLDCKLVASCGLEGAPVFWKPSVV